MIKHSARHPRLRAHRGFALLVTIVLVAFLVLILVGLATFTRVETQVATNSQQIAAARQNALMALNIAVGQLQQAAGPDQRVTARADILDSNTGTVESEGIKQPYWTAVWPTGSGRLDSPASGTGQRETSTGETVGMSHSAKLTAAKNNATWMVSRPTTSTVLDPALGTSLTVDPASVNGIASATLTQSGVTTASSASQATGVVLAKEVGLRDSSLAQTATNVPYLVAVPLSPIDVPNATIPGLGTTGNSTIGRYGFWIADEGVKAKINLAPNAASGDPQSNASGRAQNQLHFLSPATSAADQAFLTSPLNSATNTPFRDAYINASTSSLQKLLQPESIPFVLGGNYLSSPNRLKLTSPHISTYSKGVLTDVRNGGLKKDLTAALENQSQFSTLTNRYTSSVDGAGSKIWSIPGVADIDGGGALSVTMDGMRWQSLWFHYNLYKSQMPAFRASPAPVGTSPAGIGDPQSATLSVDPRTYVISGGGTTIAMDAIAPRLLAYKLEVGVSTAIVGGQYVLRLHYFPTLVLHNPYNVRLNTSNTQYLVQANAFGMDKCTIRRTTSASVTDIIYDQNLIYQQTSPSGNYVAMLYTNPADSSFEPGEVKIFGLNQTLAVNDLTKLTFSGSNARTAAYTFFGVNGTAPLVSNFASGNSQYVDYPLPSGITLNATDTIQIAIAPRIRANVFNYGARGLSRWPDSNPGTTFPNDYPSQTMVRADNVLSLSQIYDTGAGSAQQNIFSTPPTVTQLDPTTTGGSIQRIGALIVRVKGRSPASSNVAAPIQGGSGGPLNSLDISQSSALFDVNNLSGTGFTASNDLQRDPSNTALSLWGLSDAGRSGGTSNYILKELPIQPMISIGQFMHLTAASYYAASNTFVTRNNFSLYPVGGSYPNPFIPDLKTFDRQVFNGVAAYNGLYFDDQYLNNEALFDSFFFSTVPPDIASNPLPAGTRSPTGWTGFNQTSVDNGVSLLNPRHVFCPSSSGRPPSISDLRDLDKAAGGLLVDGAFNVNSTSIPAWRAILASLRYTSQPTDSNPLPRITSVIDTLPTGDDLNKGLRVLTDTQVNSLAEAIVTQVKTRGPFLTMADFLNRRLVDGALGQAGALQAAIEASGINSGALSSSGLGGVNTRYNFPSGFGGATGAPPYQIANTPSNTAELAPGCISQADLIQALAPILTVRSDTFVIRTYGESINPATNSSEGRAWCEAVVQRMPEYIIPKPQVNGNDPQEIPTAFSDNARFGRRLKIISFRWLTDADL